jgi:hypothetical protein
MIFEYAKSAGLIIVALAVFVPLAINVMTETPIPDQLWVFASAVLTFVINEAVRMLARRK